MFAVAQGFSQGVSPSEVRNQAQVTNCWRPGTQTLQGWGKGVGRGRTVPKFWKAGVESCGGVGRSVHGCVGTQGRQDGCQCLTQEMCQCAPHFQECASDPTSMGTSRVHVCPSTRIYL